MTDWSMRAHLEGTPLIDDNRLTFVWLGDRPPVLRSDLSGWWTGARPWTMERVEAGVWIYGVSLPNTAYLEYAFFDGEQRLRDPLNPRVSPTGYGTFNNYVYMPAAPRPAWQAPRPDMAIGRMSEIELNSRFVTDGHRRVRLYHPPKPGTYPLLVVFDGSEYNERARLPTILDNLIDQRRIPPLAAALVDNHPQARIPEYACSEATVNFLTSELLPWVQSQVELVTTPGAFGVAGSSMGGLISLYVGLRRPDLFGHVLAQSGAYGWRDESIVFQMARWAGRLPLRVYQSVGTFEWLLTINRRMNETLMQHNYDTRYHEFDAGHNYPAWAADLTTGLTWLYGQL